MTNEELLVSEELETLASELLVSHLIALSQRLEAEGDTYLEQANSERVCWLLNQLWKNRSRSIPLSQTVAGESQARFFGTQN